MRRFFDWLDARTDYRPLLRPIRNRVLPSGPSWWLTSASCLLWLFAIELVTGLALMATYSPSMASAWASVHYISQSTAGSMLRGLHYYTSHALILAFLVHVARVVLTAAFRAPRELIWVTGLLLIPLMIAWAVTGNPLSANQKGMAQIEVEANILGSTPVVGPTIRRILIGGDTPGNLTLTHLYFFHVGLFPMLAFALLAVHISQVYRHGLSPLGQPRVERRAMPYWPHQTIRNLAVLSIVVGTVVLLSWRFGAPLDAPTDANLPQMPRPEWYFRWLFELRRYFTGQWEFVATLVVPLVVLIYFLLLPIVDRIVSRRYAMLLRLLTVFVGIGIWGWLTFASLAADWNDAGYLATQRTSRDLATRARLLADARSIPIEGAVALLRNDPKTQGPLLFQRHCASCHSHADEQGQGIVSQQVSAPNLYGFGTPRWIAGLLDPDKLALPNYFGNTKLADGEMAGKLHELFDAAVTDAERARLREQMALVARALAAEARLPASAAADRRDADQIAEGIELMRAELACTDCHRHRDQGDLGSAPDLSGYGSREWLAGMISNPQHERFYPGDRNDRMPAFVHDPQHPGQNILNPRELELLVAWLRGEWYDDQRSSTGSASGIAAERIEVDGQPEMTARH
ncbi:MAG: cytochrome b N-terminal domain-containing protein [Planctomycetia bacterium]|nr:cytochrome b N-terminal domain-containing protein [Planctomycetia bacterium]